ncbi:predicted protein [Sclerotinia sclerotiorum 1980 UF-70]|uniref:Uncharacterized protein n=2 Tax=Sclerotinia sclerotiorum (strain ATCC 18683 / 1980 / Ss-1) TaxID=665079 RepID=A7ESL2_SCLS1|nr:predicted protein [Sclerotinia sclerotiorum 1980 UF-70]APA12854.1 hypothetical protein sscle_10g076240 [Sclerotinia sclerotiorum 1980 UF-70]EDN92454.1 predicted protein [Sclerotinia sclerotiorum 1980 UF-70]
MRQLTLALEALTKLNLVGHPEPAGLPRASNTSGVMQLFYHGMVIVEEYNKVLRLPSSLHKPRPNRLFPDSFLSNSLKLAEDCNHRLT